MTETEITLDARDDIARGQTPCTRIMTAAASLRDGQTLRLLAPFEPAPLLEKLGAEGFGHEARELDGGNWEVRFSRSIRTNSITRLGLPQPGSATGGCGCHAAPPPVAEELVYDALRTVMDPELGMNLVELGLVYSVEIAGDRVRIALTLTSRGCPMQESLVYEVRRAVLSLDPVQAVEVDLVWDPPWNPSMMTAAARARFGGAA